MSDKPKIHLGRLKQDAGTYAAGENIYLTRHDWACGWYWSFGWVGNKNCHFHFDSLLYPKNAKGQVLCCASEIFEKTNIGDKAWWVIRDLFVQAYALQKAAEVYRNGGHQTREKGVTGIVRNPERADQINADLKLVLDLVWDVVCNAVKEKP
jgi:hypothetical protein